jgi:cell division topological specificity factor
MTLRDAINKLLGRQPASANTAKQRLQLVLAHDRSDLNPELLQQMRREILEVVSRYVEIDLEEVDMSLETEDRVTALVANLPIKRARALPVQAMEDQAPADRAIPSKTPEGSEESTDFTAKISSSTSV